MVVELGRRTGVWAPGACPEVVGGQGAGVALPGALPSVGEAVGAAHGPLSTHRVQGLVLGPRC